MQKFNEFINEKYNISNEDENFTINYGLIVLNREDIENGIYEILHFVGYEKEPTDIDISSLKEELNTDESLGLIGLGENLIIIKASEETVDEYKGYVSKKNNLLFEEKVTDVEHIGHGVKYHNEVFPGFNSPKKYEGKGKYKFRVLGREGDKIKVINFGKKDETKKDSITKLTKKYWERFWR